MNGLGNVEEERGFPLQSLWEAVGGKGQLAELLERLKTASGTLLSPDRLLRLADVLHALSARGVRFGTSAEAAAILTPLLVTSGEAQLSATREIEGFWGSVRTEGGRAEDIAEVDISRSPLSGARKRLALILALLLMMIVGAVGIILQSNAIHDLIVPVPVPQTTPSLAQASFFDWFGHLLASDLIHRLFAFLAVTTLALVWWKLRKQGQTRLARERSQGALASLLTPDTDTIVFSTSALRRAGRLLRRPVKVRGSRIDVYATIAATIAAGGFFKLVPGMASRTPDCLILVDRVSRNDHLASLASALAKRLKDGGADLLRYDFRTYPDVVEAVGRRYGGKSVLSLNAVARRHPGARVIVISTGRGFFEPFEPSRPRREKPYFGDPTDTLASSLMQSGSGSARVLPSFGDGPILLTPTPPDRWGPRERSLSEMGFTVIPLGKVEEPTAGLFGAVESLLGERKTHGAEALVARHATPSEDPLMVDLERVELLSDIPPRDPLYRKKLASRIITYATKDLSATEITDIDPNTVPPVNAELEARAALVALVLFPKIGPNLTPQIWAAITGQRLDASRLSRLSRLPWFRSGYMPDWLRADIAASFQAWLAETQRSQERWHALRAELASFATACLDRPSNAESIVVYRRPSTLNSALSELKLMLHETSPADRTFMEDRLFLTFVEGGTVADDDMLSVELGRAERPTATMLVGLLAFAIAALIAAIFTPWALRLLIEAGYASAMSDNSKSTILALNCLLTGWIFFGPPLTGETASSKAIVAAGVVCSVVSYPIYATTPGVFSWAIVPTLNLVLLALALLVPSKRKEPLASNLLDGDSVGLEFSLIFAIVSMLISIGSLDGLDAVLLVSILFLLVLNRYSSPLWTIVAVMAYFMFLLLLADFFTVTFPSLRSQTWATPVMMVFAGLAARRRSEGDARRLDLKILAFILIAHMTASALGAVIGDSFLLGGIGAAVFSAFILYVVSRRFIKLLPITTFSRRMQSLGPAIAFLSVGNVASRWPRLASLEIVGKAVIFGVAAASLFGLSVWLPKTLGWIIGLRLTSEFVFAVVALHLFRVDALSTKSSRGWLWLAFPALFLLGLVPLSYDGTFGMKWSALPYLALPLAIVIATKWGSHADRPIILGLIPFLIAFKGNGWSTPGGIWMAIAAVAISEVVRNERLAAIIAALQGVFNQGSTGARILKLLVPLFLLSMSVDAPNWIGFPAIDPEPMRLILVILLGISAIPSRPSFLGLLTTTVTTTALAFLLSGQQSLGDTGIDLYLHMSPYEILDVWIAFLAMPLASFCWQRGSASRATILVQVMVGFATGATLLPVADLTYGLPGNLSYALQGPFTVPLLAWIFGLVSLWRQPTSPLFWAPGIVAIVVASTLAEPILQLFGLSSGVGAFYYIPDLAAFAGFAIFGFHSAKFLASAIGHTRQPSNLGSSSYQPVDERAFTSEARA